MRWANLCLQLTANEVVEKPTSAQQTRCTNLLNNSHTLQSDCNFTSLETKHFVQRFCLTGGEDHRNLVARGEGRGDILLPVQTFCQSSQQRLVVRSSKRIASSGNILRKLALMQPGPSSVACISCFFASTGHSSFWLCGTPQKTQGDVEESAQQLHSGYAAQPSGEGRLRRTLRLLAPWHDDGRDGRC